MISLAFSAPLAYAPTVALAPSISSVRRAGPPVLNLQQRATSAALGAALAASISVNAASAADPWPYSTLVSKVQTDEVAKVCKNIRAPPPTGATLQPPLAAAHAKNGGSEPGPPKSTSGGGVVDVPPCSPPVLSRLAL